MLHRSLLRVSATALRYCKDRKGIDPPSEVESGESVEIHALNVVVAFSFRLKHSLFRIVCSNTPISFCFGERQRETHRE